MTLLTKVYEFSATHELDEATGTREPLHGHTYQLEVSVEGTADETFGLICSRDHLDAAVDETLLKPYNFKHLNQHFENTSSEYLAVKFKELLQNNKYGLNITQVAIQETSKNRFVS